MKFIKPTALEVKTQFAKHGILDPKLTEQFINYYESNGWHVGRVKMKSWKHAVANWALKNKPEQEQPLFYKPTVGTTAYEQMKSRNGNKQ
jgi:hypothetical protein